MRVFGLGLIAAALAVWLLADPCEARRDPWQVGPHLLIAVPMDDFQNVSGVGGGLGIRGNYELSDVFSIRGDAAYLSYGRKFETLYFGPSIGFLQAETTSQNYRLSLGPQLSFYGTKFIVYTSGQAGAYLFRTAITVPGTTYSDSRDTHWALGWNGALGVQFDVGLGPWLDVGVAYQTMYDLPGPTRENPDDPDAAPIQGDDITAQELTIELGIQFFLKK
ncbi:MAG: outer membrane beta-barrel protein [Candidatus Eisenbacteria bacterium]|uniref:Outer membrane beta-barrel protein n=1 Tax=Eiseniibacteriota bacterium TaxID=2212470 RepID=A0A956NBE3_UNCEI|nr:outer membrane beta-barrel protein [Candidatus Eisenbacteria bacterium]MCB9465209.1 outer membrane beta-barrel protein [Candidatus Eisenbacteria bacterium]